MVEAVGFEPNFRIDFIIIYSIYGTTTVPTKFYKTNSSAFFTRSPHLFVTSQVANDGVIQ